MRWAHAIPRDWRVVESMRFRSRAIYCPRRVFLPPAMFAARLLPVRKVPPAKLLSGPKKAVLELEAKGWGGRGGLGGCGGFGAKSLPTRPVAAPVRIVGARVE